MSITKIGDDWMTEIRYCKNCKHLGLDGMFGLICDARGNNKNYDCPKYEEKGVLDDWKTIYIYGTI